MYRYFTDLDFRWAMQGGLKMLSIRLDSIESTRIVSPVVDSSCRKSICETRAPCESSRIVKCFRRVDSVSYIQTVQPIRSRTQLGVKWYRVTSNGTALREMVQHTSRLIRAIVNEQKIIRTSSAM